MKANFSFVIKIAIWFSCLLLLSTSFKSNGHDKDRGITRKGYLVYFEVFGWFFQPCDDPNISFQESLNLASFNIYYGTDGYNYSLKDFETTYLDKMNADTVFYKQLSKEDNEYVGEIKYKYVEMEYENSFSPLKKTQNIPMCMVEFSKPENEQKKYKLGCQFFEAIIHKITLLKY